MSPNLYGFYGLLLLLVESETPCLVTTSTIRHVQYTIFLQPFQLGLDGPELLHEEVAVMSGIQVAEVLSDRVQGDDRELTPNGRITLLRD